MTMLTILIFNVLIVFATICFFVFRHLDNNQLENLTSGIFDQQRFLYEL